jgi:UDP-N-acetylmuramoyl-L-alanyl-D-glutamate--2,6-diaminopimelate ligase
LRLKNLLEGVKIKYADTNALETSVEDISFDSRCIKKNSVFVAYGGTDTDSHKYIEDVKKSGKVSVFVTEKPVEGALSVVVDSGRKALALMSKSFFGVDDDKLIKIAVTGTNGKTTVNYLLESIFTACGYRTIKIGTTEYKIIDETIKADTTTPSPYDYYRILSRGLKKGANVLCVEVSSHALMQHRLYGTNFDLAIFTNLTGDHLDYHKTMESYYNAKKLLFRSDYSKKCLVNIDSEYGRKILDECDIDTFTYGIERKADFRGMDLANSLDGVSFNMKADKLAKIRSNLVGTHNIYNILAAIAAADILKLDLHKIVDGVEKLKNVPGRLEKFEIKGRYFFVDYAHTDDALENVLKSLYSLKKKRIITVFGCGGNRDKTKRPRMAKVSEKYSDVIIVTSDNPRKENPREIIKDIEKGFSSKSSYEVVIDRRQAIQYAYELSEEGDIILVAGKGHENYQILKNKTIHFDDREEIQNLERGEYRAGV